MTPSRMLVMDTNALPALNDGLDHAWDVLENHRTDRPEGSRLAVTAPFVTVAELAALSARAGTRGDLEACDELAAFAMALVDPVHADNLFDTSDIRLRGSTETAGPRDLLDYTDAGILQVIVSEPGNGAHDVPVGHPRVERLRRVTLSPAPDDFDVIQTADLVADDAEDVRLFTPDFGAYRAAQRWALPTVDQPHFARTDATSPRTGFRRVHVDPIDLATVGGPVVVPLPDLLVAVLLGEKELTVAPGGGVVTTTLAVAQSAAHRALRRSVRAHLPSTLEGVRAAFSDLVTTGLSIAAVDGRLLSALVGAAAEEERWRYGYPDVRPADHQQVVPIRVITVAEIIASLPESVPVTVVDTATEPGDHADLPRRLAADPLRYPLLALLARRSARGVVATDVTIEFRDEGSAAPVMFDLRDLARDVQHRGRRRHRRPEGRR